MTPPPAPRIPDAGLVSLDGGRAAVDFGARRLLVMGRPVKLGARAFDLLAVLLSERDRVVPKPELLDRVWPGLVVEENNLQVHVMTLRRLLGAPAIVTVSGRGYRWTMAVDAATAAPVPAAAAADGLIGRDDLVAQALALLAAGTRLLLLLGPGGAGKTRLALRVAAWHAARLDDGATTVLLAPVRDSRHIVAAIAAALGVQESGATPLAELVQRTIGTRALLLLLDNLEHLPGAGDVAASLLAACPRLQLLATSRAPLHVSGEVRLAVPPLALPQGDDDIGALRAAPALRLFAERAAGLGRPLADDAGTLRAAAEVCRRVDGLPLAIELAAARLRVLTPQALAARLRQRLPLLRGGAIDAPQRQQTLRHAIAWSHDLLDAPVQRLFRQLAVFVGGWSIDAAEQVGDDSGACVDRLEQLLDQSLVQRIDDVDGEPRYTMLETVREFALEQLVDSGEHDALCERHAAAMLALALALEPRVTSAARRPALLRLQAEQHNLRAALAWWLQQRADAEQGLRLAAALGWAWYFGGRFAEGRAWLAAALALPGGAAADRAAALTGASRLATYSADAAAGRQLVQQATASWRTLEGHGAAPRGLAFARVVEGVLDCIALDFEAARGVLHEAMALFRGVGDAWGTALATAYLGTSYAVPPGHEDTAEPLLLESCARFRALSDDWGESTALHYLGSIALRRGDLDAAAALTEQTLARSLELGDQFRAARNLHQLAEIELQRGHVASALPRLADSLAINLEHRRLGDVSQQLRLLADAAAQAGAPVLAVQLAAMAARHATDTRTMPPDDPAPHAALLDRLQRALGDAAWRAAWAGGTARPLDDAVAIARGLGGVSPPA